MRLVHVRRGEVAVVGGDQRHAERIRQRDQPGLDARVRLARPWRCSSIATRSGNASAKLREQAFGLRLLALRQQARRAGRRCRRSAGSARRHARRSRRARAAASGRDRCPGSRRDDRRWRLARPAASCASSTIGSGGRRGLSARASAIWQPMIGWMPLAAQAWLNSSAPNRLAVSVIATAGMPRVARQGRDFFRLDGAFAERIGGMDAEMDEIGVGRGQNGRSESAQAQRPRPEPSPACSARCRT